MAAIERHATSTPAAIRRVSIVAPMWNEADHVEDFVADIAAQDFLGDIELLVADGCSSDGSPRLLRAAADRHGLAVRLFENRARWVSHALNMCIRAAEGDLIIRVDCHSRYPSDYVRRCVMAAEETGADNVGGIFIPQGRTAMERAVAAAMDSPFGGIHWTRHEHRDRVACDTVPYGAFRPDAFRRVGLFDESLLRNQDDEFNLRLRLAGGRIVLDPAIRIYYRPRGSFSGLFRQYYEYGVWKVPVMLKHRRVVSARSLAPVAFVVSLAVLAALTPWSRAAGLVLAGEAFVYAAGALFFGTRALARRGEPRQLLPRIVLVFPTFHLAHGTGMLAGWVRAALTSRPNTEPTNDADWPGRS